MRVRIFALLVAVLCAVPVAMIGCNNDDDNTTGDMAMAPDQSVAGGKSCTQIATCAAACTGAMAAQCAATCAQGGTPAALTKYNALIQCATLQCIATGGGDGGTTDGGATKPCSSATDTSAACVSCIGSAGQSAACATQLSACLAP